MPHSTSSGTTTMRAPSLNRSSNLKPHAETNGNSHGGGTERFPDFDLSSSGHGGNGRSPSPCKPNGYVNGSAQPSDRWKPRRDSQARGVRWAPTGQSQDATAGHARHTSFSNAIRTIRSGSVSQNAHEIADALRAPVSYKLLVRPITRFGLVLVCSLDADTETVDPLRDVVLVLRLDQHLVQVHPERL